MTGRVSTAAAAGVIAGGVVTGAAGVMTGGGWYGGGGWRNRLEVQLREWPVQQLELEERLWWLPEQLQACAKVRLCLHHHWLDRLRVHSDCRNEKACHFACVDLKYATNACIWRGSATSMIALQGAG